MNGDIDGFIESYLKFIIKNKKKRQKINFAFLCVNIKRLLCPDINKQHII